jgi:hypothetical protein
MADFQAKICEKFNINSMTADRNPWLAKMMAAMFAKGLGKN